MPFNHKPQKFNAAINTVEIGCGEKAIKLGGECVFPLYTFDDPIENAPKVGILVSDMEADVVEAAKKAEATEGADFICLSLEGGDPNGADKSVEELVEVVKAVAEAVTAPIVVEGSKNVEKDSALLPKVAEALQGKNALIMSAREEDYKTVGAAVGLAYEQKLGAESAVDINLAKQLNVVLTQLGVKPASVVMNVGTAAAGYGYEYVVSTMDRIKAAALSQGDATLQMPIVTPVAGDAWSVKESVASEEDMPEWGPQEERGIAMEIMTAAADLASGSNAVILRHPQSVATISKMIKELM
ncbi:MAG: acetyl-CoA decarbonylase/synthase complex subunit delta [Lachnospiraceae bacterium]